MKKVSILQVTIAVLFYLSTVYATVWYVHPDSALNSIQAGLDSCSTGDTVLVAAGIYIENLVWPNTQGLDLMSELGPDTTIINGGNSARVIDIATVVDSTTTIMGFTIRNGHADMGGGIRCQGSGPTIMGNRIAMNTADDRGGGIRCYVGSPIIRRNVIDSNTSYRGGGISCHQSSALIDSNIITYNVVTGHAGGGIRCQTASPTIRNNIITNNWSIGAGGGMSIAYSSSPLVTGNTITSNTSSTNAGGGICITHNCSVTVTDNIVSGNTAWYGGGIACNDASTGTIRRNIVTENVCTYTSPSAAGGGFDISESSSPTIDSCVIANNDSIGVYCLDNSTPLIQFNNIYGHALYGVKNEDSTLTVTADSNWWGDATGPYHPTANPSGLGDAVSDYVDFEPWLEDSVLWVGVEEQTIVKPVETYENLRATIFSGPLQLPEGKECKVFDITGRVVEPDKMRPGIYFLEIDNKIVQKVIKIR